MLFKILIVENEANLLEKLNANLQQQGYRVESAQDWETALDLAHRFQPNLVILDTMLPGLNALDLTRQAKRHLDDAQIYFWSARESDALKANRAGVCAKDDVGRTFSTLELPARIKAHFRSAQILQMLQEEAVFS